MWPRLRLDVEWSNLLSGVLPGRETAPAPDGELVCLSVRTAFDLWLRALALPQKSEVLMSALTIPHMPAIAVENGLVPVPVDLDPRTMAPAPASLARACTPRSRVLVVAHLFGGRVRLEPLAAFARARGLLLVEDCAQAFDAHGCPLHAGADVALYSFGTIKTATALGGAVARVRDERVLSAMRRLHDGYPRQPDGEHRRKLARAALLKLLATRGGFGAFAALLKRRGRDLDDFLQGAVAGFPGPELFARLRRRPSASLERLLARRLRGFPPRRIAARKRAGDLLARTLPARLARPGADALLSTHWVFPVLVPEPDRAVAALRRAGFDATHRSSLQPIAAPPGHPCGAPRAAQALLERLIFLPCSAAMPDGELARLADVLVEASPYELIPSAPPAASPRAAVERERDLASG
jgi:dTDP-4-amino-4,6-dideoxygalactose transaminase